MLLDIIAWMLRRAMLYEERGRDGYQNDSPAAAVGILRRAWQETYGATRPVEVDEVGKPPDLVLEVASESTGRRDYTFKRDGYEKMGVGEYWRFDPSGGIGMMRRWRGICWWI